VYVSFNQSDAQYQILINCKDTTAVCFGKKCSIFRERSVARLKPATNDGIIFTKFHNV